MKFLSVRELSLVLCDDLEGWDGVGGRFKREEIRVYIWMITLMYSRN